MLKITVPASSANLGAGFDALGLALTLYNRVWMEEADGCHIAATDGAAIPIEERDPAEVLPAPIPGVDVWNPAFDVTPADLITAIITERGAFAPADIARACA